MFVVYWIDRNFDDAAASAAQDAFKRKQKDVKYKERRAEAQSAVDQLDGAELDFAALLASNFNFKPFAKSKVANPLARKNFQACFLDTFIQGRIAAKCPTVCKLFGVEVTDNSKKVKLPRVRADMRLENNRRSEPGKFSRGGSRRRSASSVFFY